MSNIQRRWSVKDKTTRWFGNGIFFHIRIRLSCPQSNLKKKKKPKESWEWEGTQICSLFWQWTSWKAANNGRWSQRTDQSKTATQHKTTKPTKIKAPFISFPTFQTPSFFPCLPYPNSQPIASPSVFTVSLIVKIQNQTRNEGEELQWASPWLQISPNRWGIDHVLPQKPSHFQAMPHLHHPRSWHLQIWSLGFAWLVPKKFT